MLVRFFALIVSLLALAAPAFAADANHDIKGLYLLTDYPAVTVQPGTTSTVNLKLRNYALAPERLALSVAGVPQGWTATLLGGGQPIAAAMPATDDSVSLDLRLDVPKDAKIGTHTLTVSADGGTSHVTLPVAVTLAKELPAKLTLSSAIARAARLLALELRIYDDHQERQRQEAAGQSRRRRAEEFRHLVHRGLWHPAAYGDPGRRRQDQGREAQGQPAGHRRCRALSGDRAHRRRGRARYRQGRARYHRPAQALARRPRRLAQRARHRRQAKARFRSR